ncbi:SPOR domain-containing protein [Roseobacter sp. HKCCA0434]|uniref:SPOR domain-containing protein n=1 Tax=Roseobacter sp. HKCCA0434 TaxID=3079297 RepID=UPI002905F287|nr:SPOR domain-containing protein [Roseobacter sp. HKCCA0434]
MRRQSGDEAERGGTMAAIGRGVAALVSLALVVMLGLWVWRLGTQDVTQVPVILAQEGPMRVQPEDPGGTTAAHQGLEVNELMTGEEVQPVPSTVTLAPEPLEPDRPEPEPEPEAVAGTEEAEEDLGADAPTVATLRPRARPADLGRSRRAASTPVPEAIDASAIPVGAHMIQLGAFDSEPVALLQWAGIVEAQPDLMGGKQRYIEQTTSGGRTLYRLRAVGYDSATETRAACAALTARGLQCIPVRRR